MYIYNIYYIYTHTYNIYGRFVHRVFLSGIEGGDYWLDMRVIYRAFSQFGHVSDVFLPKGKKVTLP
jgi:hypothetical protein